MLDNKYASMALVAVVSNVPVNVNAGEIDYSKPFDLAGISTINEYTGGFVVGDDSSSNEPSDDDKCFAMGYSQTTCEGSNCDIVSYCEYDNSYVKCGCYCNAAESCLQAGFVHIDDFVPCVDIPVCQEEEVQCSFSEDYYSCKCHCDIAQICSDDGYTETSCPPELVASDCPYDDTYKNCL